MKEIGWIAILAGAAAVEFLTAPVSPRTGQDWQLSHSSQAGRIHFTVERSRPGSHSIDGSDVPLSNFHGISSGVLERSGPVSFEYLHDAGSLVCTGKISWGRGSGSFTLKPNPDFVSQLNGLGLGSPNDEELFSLMLGGVTLEFLRGVQAAGIRGTLHDMMDLHSHGVTVDSIRALNDAGFHPSQARDYIELHDHGVNAHFVEALRHAGYDLPSGEIVELSAHGVGADDVRRLEFYGLHPRAGELVDLHAHGVTPEYLHSLKDAGFGAVSTDQAIELHSHGVPGEFAQGARDLGYRFAPGELVDLHAHGVNTPYLHGLKDAGYGTISAAQAIELHSRGVPGEFAQAARDLGYRFTPGELIDLHAHGVSTQYLRRLHDSGMQGLTEPQIAQLHAHGVD